MRRPRLPTLRPHEVTRFWRSVDRPPFAGSCWTWTGHAITGGSGALYGEFRPSRAGRTLHVKAHRLAFYLTRGWFPEHFDVDHVCRNTLCVRPDHLEPVPHAENVRRARAASRRPVSR